MRKKIVSLSLLMLFMLPIIAQKSKDAPKWINYEKRSLYFPADEYIKGFSSENLNNVTELNDAQSRLTSSARTILNESVLTEIKSMTTSNLINTTHETFESLKQVSVSVSKLKLTDLVSDFYYDPKTKNAFAFAYAPKIKVRDNYKSILETNNLKLKNLLEYAEDPATQNKITLLNKLIEGEKFVQESSNAFSVLMALDGGNKAEYQPFLTDALEIQKKLSNHIAKIQQSKDLRSDETQEFIAQNIAFQLKNDSLPIWISNFSFENSGIISPYSAKFAMGLSQKMYSQKVKLTKNTKLKEKYILKGFFWNEKEHVKVNISVINMETGDIVAAVESGISKTYIENNSIKIEPENYNQAIKNLALFNENFVSSNGGLTVSLATNKGSENLLFEENDTLKMYIKANRPCFVRFIYHLADGQKALLYDNYHITASQTNKVIEIPQYFVCTDPYGVETLQVIAQTEEFANLEIHEQYGYKFIDGNLQNVLKKSRGFKAVKPEDGSAEQFMMMTTMPKTW